ncbi:Receptor protein kinase [Melia azedarach]|uniref:Receptor protein kinase n=1 Tax=Melia azedarach TaxID=155640 RepID=A0ACC1Y0A0_MELAZ|nr:Receptor protein kinase [Melia azedarach]
MAISAFQFVLLLSLLQTWTPSSSTSFDVLERGASLSEKTNDRLISPNGVFSAGFLSVGENAFGFAIWYSNINILPNDHTVVWMANRDEPVGRKSKLSLLKNGNLILKDAGRKVLWSTATAVASSHSPVKLQLDDSGNLVLRTSDGENTLWQSFDSPTDTILPKQLFTKDTRLISSRSKNNFSSGNYKLFFDNDNVLRLLYHVPQISSLYWPPAWEWPYEAGRTTYNDTRTAVLDQSGYFISSDGLEFSAADLGVGPLRRLTLDLDGNLRLYSFEEKTKEWVVSWQAILQLCTVHGICGPNGVCTYAPSTGRRSCSCLPGYKVKNDSDWSSGCEPEFSFSNHTEYDFLNITHLEFYGYDTGAFPNVTLQECKEKCMNLSSCKGFQYKFNIAKFEIAEKKLGFTCYPKTSLFNGQHQPGFSGDIYLKLPKSNHFFNQTTTFKVLTLNCKGNITQAINRSYEEPRENRKLNFLLWFAVTVGLVEMVCIFLVWFFLFMGNEDSVAIKQGYTLAATGLKKFTYGELKKATKSFTREIGRGAGGVVYRALLSDQRVAAVKHLNDAKQGEAEFLTELKTIEKLNHMNLIEMWGYCAEGKRRLLVYEYMEHGSLADNLHSNSISWDKRFEIAVGTAKGLAYLHDECLEWVLHCDIKPQNILLDSNYRPKVADFGLSKLQSRGGLNDSSFSRIRGTRGYMAPEWVYNLPITSKVDVYSYGIVLLEMVTGKSPAAAFHSYEKEGMKEHGTLVTWVREKKNVAGSKEAWIKETVDPMIAGNYDVNKIEIMVEVALQCVEEDSKARPSMSKVVEMLLSFEDDHDQSSYA